MLAQDVPAEVLGVWLYLITIDESEAVGAGALLLAAHIKG